MGVFMKLYHATHLSRLQAIVRQGMHSHSYWASDEAVSDYYVETIEDEGGVAVVLSIDLAALEALCSEKSLELEPDYPGLMEPITTAVGKTEDEIFEGWDDCDGTWRECLELIGSLRSPVEIPASLLAVECGDDAMSLADYLQSQVGRSSTPSM
jgi:hypothetical protein